MAEMSTPNDADAFESSEAAAAITTADWADEIIALICVDRSTDTQLNWTADWVGASGEFRYEMQKVTRDDRLYTYYLRVIRFGQRSPLCVYGCHSNRRGAWLSDAEYRPVQTDRQPLELEMEMVNHLKTAGIEPGPAVVRASVNEAYWWLMGQLVAETSPAKEALADLCDAASAVPVEARRTVACTKLRAVAPSISLAVVNRIVNETLGLAPREILRRADGN